MPTVKNKVKVQSLISVEVNHKMAFSQLLFLNNQLIIPKSNENFRNSCS